MDPEPPSPKWMFVWLGSLFEGFLGVLALFLGWAFNQPPLELWRWDAADAVRGVAATAPMLVLFLGCLRWPVGPLARIKQIAEQFIRPLFAECGVLELAMLAGLAGLGEEMLFRGFLQAKLAGWLGLWPGLATASLLFGLLHFITPTYAVLATILGLFLGLLFVATQNLLTVVMAHGLYDVLALVYLMRRKPGNP